MLFIKLIVKRKFNTPQKVFLAPLSSPVQKSSNSLFSIQLVILN